MRFVILLLCFFVDVHVKAEASKIKMIQGRKVLPIENGRLTLDSETLVRAEANGEWRLIRGSLYVETSEQSDPIFFDTPYARILCSKQCRGILVRQTKAVVIKNLAGNWRVQRMGDKIFYSVPEAMQTWVSEVNTDGVAEMDFPQSLPWLSTAKEWGRLYPGDFQEFKKQLAQFRSPWKKAVENGIRLDQEVADREISSVNEARAQEARQKQAIERENQKLRSLFREKNYLSQ